MKNIIQKTLYCLYFLQFVSCSYITDLKRTGDIITVEYDVSSATHIEIFAPVRLIPVIHNESKIKIIGMDFIVEDYVLTHSEEKIVVEHKKPIRIQEHKIADLYLYTPKIERITVNYPGKLHSNDTLYFDNLVIVINGRAAYTTGNLILKGNNLRFYAFGTTSKCNQILSGEVRSALLHIEGGARLNALELSTVSAKIVHKSFGHCHVAVSEQLDVEIFASGNLYYKGNPQTTFEWIENNLMKATGKIIQIE